jgi:hypothetical protein
MANVSGNDSATAGRLSASDSAESRMAERDRQIADIYARAAEFDPESTPEWEELIASQEEFRARIKERIRRITGREPRWR